MRPSNIRAGALLALCAVSACATTRSGAPTLTEVASAEVSLSDAPRDAQEAAAIEAAKRHPIATTYQRPRDPNALPVAPPKIPAGSVPAPPPVAPRDRVLVVGESSPTSQVARPPKPAVMTSVPDRSYVWVDGGWVAEPAPVTRTYVDGGVWIGASPWGWGAHRPYGAVVVAPHAHPGHWHGHWHHPRYHTPRRRYAAPPAQRWVAPKADRRRDVYVAPRVRAPRSGEPRVYTAPTARRAPQAAPPARSTPSSRGRAGGDSGRRSVYGGARR